MFNIINEIYIYNINFYKKIMYVYVINNLKNIENIYVEI